MKMPFVLYIPLAAMFIISMYFAAKDADALKTACFIEETAFPVNTVAETEEAVKRANIEVTEAHELETGEEESEAVSLPLSEEEPDAVAKDDSADEAGRTDESEAAVENDREVPYYSYKGREPLDHRLQYHLYDLWQRFDLPEEWYKYAIGLIYQECGFHRDSVNHNPDGSSDVGFFQYNTRWFAGTAAKYGSPDLDINNNFHQAYLFVLQTKDRMNQGLSLEECISRHRRGDYDGYDAEYVALVFQRTASLTIEE